MMPEWMFHKETPGHGYFYVTDARFRRMRAEHPELLTHTDFYTGGNSFEEDCEVNRIVLAFPDEFSDEHVRGAERWVLDYQPEIAALYFGRKIKPQESRLLRERLAFQENRDKYVSHSAVTIGGGMTGVWLVRGGVNPDTHQYASDDKIMLAMPRGEYHPSMVVEDPSAYEAWDGKSGWLS
jgi:hypothetical protein